MQFRKKMTIIISNHSKNGLLCTSEHDKSGDQDFTQTVLDGLTIYPPVANVLQCIHANHYESWLIGSRHRYCNNNKAYFILGHTMCSYLPLKLFYLLSCIYECLTDASCNDTIRINSKCHTIHREHVNWFTAVNRCLSNNATLAVFDDNVRQYFPRSLLSNTLWIGLVKSWWTWTGLCFVL